MPFGLTIATKARRADAIVRAWQGFGVAKADDDKDADPTGTGGFTR